MYLKIKGRTPEELQENITKIMNIAFSVFSYGYLPKLKDIEDPRRTGMYWYYDIDTKKYHLYPIMNDHKAFVREETELSQTVEFKSRYESEFKETQLLTKLILAVFPKCDVELVNTIN